jgi:RNA polymerase sigma-70 factor (ECF subfamily)
MTTSTAALRPIPSLPASRDGFDALCRVHAPRLLAHLRRKARSTQDAEDVCQETLARAWRDWEVVSGLACPHAWLFVVANRLLIDGWRRRAATDSRTGLLSEDRPTLDHCDALAVRQAVAALPHDVRTAVVLYYFEDWTISRIAADAGVGTETIKSRLHRGRAALGAELRAAWGLAA